MSDTATAAEKIIRVLLIDDHAIVREGYRHLLATTDHIRVVAEADSGSAGYQRYLQGDIDVVVIDLSLPGIGGMEILRRMKHHDPKLRALVFSMHEERMIVERALTTGALGYLSKRSEPGSIVQAITRVAKGLPVVDPIFGSAADFNTLRAASSVPAPNPARWLLERLSHREFEIFRQLAEGRRVSEIASHLCLSDKTVANYHTSIRSKLGLGTSADLARLAISAGIIHVG